MGQVVRLFGKRATPSVVLDRLVDEALHGQVESVVCIVKYTDGGLVCHMSEQSLADASIAHVVLMNELMDQTKGEPDDKPERA